MAAAYIVGGGVQLYPETSVLSLNGSFDPEKAIPGTQAILDAIDAAREHEYSVDDLERAKRAVVAQRRKALQTNTGIASLFAEAALLGLGPEQVQVQPALIRAVTASDVRGVARRYLDLRMLRLVLLGSPDDLKAAPVLGFGEPAVTDAFGRLRPNAKPRASR
jgi:predicted Zn-dependent peptidase